MQFELMIKRAFPLLLLLMALTFSAMAQTSASLSGTVTDPNGGAVAGAKITVSNPAMNLAIEAKTSADGSFSFPTLQPGTYTVTIEASGFKKTVKSGIVLNIADRQSTGAIVLEVGDISNTVEITADASQLLLKTESAEQSQVISGEQVGALFRLRKTLHHCGARNIGLRIFEIFVERGLVPGQSRGLHGRAELIALDLARLGAGHAPQVRAKAMRCILGDRVAGRALRPGRRTCICGRSLG